MSHQSQPDPSYPTIYRHDFGGYVWTDCPECGPDVLVDEDGCCRSCGEDAVRYGREPVLPTPEAGA